MITFDEILKLFECERTSFDVAENVVLNNFSTDTRTIKKGDFYIPLKGETFDGEKFIDTAVEAGAVGYLYTNDENKVEKHHSKSRINVFNDEIKYICELDEDLFAVSQRKNEIKIIKNYSIIQTINIDDYDDLYIYSMISLPNLSSKEKNFSC